MSVSVLGGGGEGGGRGGRGGGAVKSLFSGREGGLRGDWTTRKCLAARWVVGEHGSLSKRPESPGKSLLNYLNSNWFKSRFLVL